MSDVKKHMIVRSIHVKEEFLIIQPATKEEP
jgi:hypothetical protein